MRYFYRREGRRVFTVAYSYDQETGHVQYGAAVFRRDRPNETFVKSEHRHTARGRFEKCPASLTVEDVSHLSEVENAIRENIKVYGVRGDRVVFSGEHR